jgi:two-component system sensor histidine kinase AgrC
MENFIRLILLVILLIISSLYLYGEQRYKTIFSVFFAYLLVMVSEMILAIIISLLFGNSEELVKTFGLNFLVNVGINILPILIINNKKICLKIRQYIETLRNIKNSSIIVVLITGLLFVGAFLYFIYFKPNIVSLLLVNFVFIVLYSYVIYRYFKDLTTTSTIMKEHQDIMLNLNEYERMYEIMRMNNHENKNQLLVIKGMINKNNKKLLKYLDDITNTGNNDDDEWFLKLRKIPIGGLKGLFYYKILSMKEKNINVSFHVSKDIKKEELTNLSEETNAVICKIMGVLLDNAIDAVTDLKEKNISLEIYNENNYIVICIANNYEGNIDFSKFGEKGFSTKGSNRGHGLSIVKQLLAKNNNIENEHQIMGNVFQQKIKIKIQ